MDTILFDLDGTLLPMDQTLFLKTYLSELGRKFAGFGYDPKQVTDAVLRGVTAMVQNDGAQTNEAVFWDTFAALLGNGVHDIRPSVESFYEREFHVAKRACGENAAAVRLVRALRRQGYTLVLASNPVFPANAYRTRLGWIGLAPEDFDHVTSYEHYHYCKPDTRYYAEILQALGRQPQDCLMVGNDVQEDGCAAQLGIGVFIVTDNLLNPEGQNYAHLRSGSFSGLCGWMARELPARCG